MWQPQIADATKLTSNYQAVDGLVNDGQESQDSEAKIN
jgi:hypothetical protein